MLSLRDGGLQEGFSGVSACVSTIIRFVSRDTCSAVVQRPGGEGKSGLGGREAREEAATGMPVRRDGKGSQRRWTERRGQM